MKNLLLFLTLLLPSASMSQTLAPLDKELKTAWPDNRTINLVFHGHSVPAGYHKTPEVKPFESYPYLVFQKLKTMYPQAVVNTIVTAIGGENSISGAARFKKDVLAHNPDLIFIDYALNDRKQPIQKVEAAWLSMIRDAKEAGIPVVLITPTGDLAADLSNPSDPLSQRADLIRKLAKQEGLILADVSAAWSAELAKGTPQKRLHSQGNHPSLEGHRIAAEAIFKAMKESGLNN